MFEDTYDYRIEGLPLMGSPYKIVSIAAIYLIFVKYVGPKFMETRKPYDLSQIMLFYNALQVFLNICLVLYSLPILWSDYFNFSCPLVDYSETARGYKIAYLGYYYFILKILDLMDTVFIVLKKNYRQQSILHVYHHTLLAVAPQIVLQHHPGGVYTFSQITNAMVHVIMYFYFLLIIMKPELKKSLWWKKYITQIQIIQFLFNMFHYVKTLTNSKCTSPTGWTWFALSQNVIFVILFLNFYVRNYNKKKYDKELSSK